jgi:hypothetical protein
MYLVSLANSKGHQTTLITETYSLARESLLPRILVSLIDNFNNA